MINTSGQLVSLFEVESSLLEFAEIVNVGVIGAPDNLLWGKVVACIKLANNIKWTNRLGLKFKLHVSNQLSSVAVPAEFVVVNTIPKNRSGKIMRRVLLVQYNGKDPGDLSTLEE